MEVGSVLDLDDRYEPLLQTILRCKTQSRRDIPVAVSDPALQARLLQVRILIMHLTSHSATSLAHVRMFGAPW